MELTTIIVVIMSAIIAYKIGNSLYILSIGLAKINKIFKELTNHEQE